MPRRYWLVHPNGGRQLIDPRQFDLGRLAEQARLLGGRLVTEEEEPDAGRVVAVSRPAAPVAPIRFEPPISAVGPLFRARLETIYECQVDYTLDINVRPTKRMLGGYYHRRRLVRVYAHDRVTGRRPLEELFDTFLHEIAHHVEYTEPHAFEARRCGRVRGRMHSELFWRILAELKRRWRDRQR
jgi:hypothetical protein